MLLRLKRARKKMLFVSYFLVTTFCVYRSSAFLVRIHLIGHTSINQLYCLDLQCPEREMKFARLGCEPNDVSYVTFTEPCQILLPFLCLHSPRRITKKPIRTDPMRPRLVPGTRCARPCQPNPRRKRFLTGKLPACHRTRRKENSLQGSTSPIGRASIAGPCLSGMTRPRLGSSCTWDRTQYRVRLSVPKIT